MSEYVTLRHPKLPPEQVIRIHPDRIRPRLAAGWEVVAPAAPEAQTPVPEPADTAPGPGPEPEPEPEPTKSRRTRRTNTTEEQ